MDYHIHSDHSGLRVTVRGRLTFAESGRFRTMLEQIRDHGAPALVMDLTQVDFVDSAGLGMLLCTHDALGHGKGAVHVVGAQGPVVRMLDLARLGHLLPSDHPARR